MKYKKDFTPMKKGQQRFHWAGGAGNEPAVEIAKPAGFNSPKLTTGKFISIWL
jgi:hypothetical protein